MADPKKKAPAPKAQKSGKKSGGAGFWGVILSLIVGVLWFLPTTVFLLISLWPTFAAWLFDTSRDKTSSITVGVMNLAGAVPFLLKLWRDGASLDHAFEILQNPITMLGIFGAAAAGLAVFYIVPAIVSVFITIQAETRIRSLKAGQQELIDSWGNDVATTKPVDEE
jgi:hypothetical protein